MKIFRSLAAFAIALVFLLAACGGGVNDDNYNKLKSGMTVSEVEAILGKPTESGGAGIGGMTAGAKTWKSGDKEITVVFANDKVASFAKKGF
jgi:hypothetical protein